MSASWPPLDLHAHIDAGIEAAKLLNLRAVIFAATRSLSEASSALARQHADLLTVWGVGVHPLSSNALQNFDTQLFSSLVAQTAYVSEIGLDGKVPSNLRRQLSILAPILGVLQENPRIASLHSHAAGDLLIAELEQTPIKGMILHWWTGSASATDRALSLGAYFSFNAAGLRDIGLLRQIPLDRILIETDHPDGDRRSPVPRHPGRVEPVEEALATIHGISRDEVRVATWRNLKVLVDETRCQRLLPARVASFLGAMPLG